MRSAPVAWIKREHNFKRETKVNQDHSSAFKLLSIVIERLGPQGDIELHISMELLHGLQRTVEFSNAVWENKKDFAIGDINRPQIWRWNNLKLIATTG